MNSCAGTGIRKSTKAVPAAALGKRKLNLSLGEHRIDGAILTISGPPATLISPQSPATVYKATYRFMINGTERNVTEACAAYLALLEKMVAQFEADHP